MDVPVAAVAAFYPQLSISNATSRGLQLNHDNKDARTQRAEGETQKKERSNKGGKKKSWDDNSEMMHCFGT